jgi:methylphosphotriester-DNA--protein-cysteine methyltransferase
MGNRGCLHDEHGSIRRFHSGKRWIFCRLEFKNRKRELMQPGLYTELFFLDEATAFAAGHRPCAECMRDRFGEFRDRWAVANAEASGTAVSAAAIDRVLHDERIGPGRSKVTFRATVGELPDGALLAPFLRTTRSRPLA